MKTIYKTAISIIALFSMFILLASCGNKTVRADYSTKQAEAALNAGKDLKGKTVNVTVNRLEPSSAFGYNIETGKHLNFVSEDNPHVKKGQKLVVKVKKVTSQLGSFIITYDKAN